MVDIYPKGTVDSLLTSKITGSVVIGTSSYTSGSPYLIPVTVNNQIIILSYVDSNANNRTQLIYLNGSEIDGVLGKTFVNGSDTITISYTSPNLYVNFSNIITGDTVTYTIINLA